MLENGKIRTPNYISQTFAANIYDLLKYQFFMTSPVGEFARVKIQQIIKAFETDSEEKNVKVTQMTEFVKTIGDDYIRNTLESLLNENRENNKVAKK